MAILFFGNMASSEKESGSMPAGVVIGPSASKANGSGYVSKINMCLVAILTGLCVWGICGHFLNPKANASSCQMTYLYEYPEYIPVDMNETVARQFPKYGLYVYGEGEKAKDLKRERYSGIPVLFVPGSSGSHQQVRYLASVALRKSLDIDYKHHFDYFSVDFNREFTALYAGKLGKQAEYVALAIDHILTLYDNQDSVVLIGHSTGGLVAKSVFTVPGFREERLSILLTLATPHNPAVLMDSHQKDFYGRVNRFWNENRKGSLRKVTFISLSGGRGDLNVRPGLTTSSHADINAMTTDIPGVWTTADHECIVWCKQLVLAINRALFDTVDEGQLVHQHQVRRSVFAYHLQNRSGGKQFLPAEEMFPRKTTFDKNGFWTDIFRRQFTFCRENVASNSYIMVKVNKADSRLLTVDALNLENESWIFGCKDTIVHRSTRMCESGENLSSGTRALFSSGGNRKTIQINLREVGEKFDFTHVVIFVPKHTEHVKVHLDVYSEEERFFKAETPPTLASFFSSPKNIVAQTSPNAVFYKLSLVGLTMPWQSYDINVTPVGECIDQSQFGVVSFISGWGGDSTHKTLLHNATSSISARLQALRPRGLDKDVEDQKPEVLIYPNPRCTYKVEIQPSWQGMGSQVIAYYLPDLIVHMMISVTLLTLGKQLIVARREGICPAFLSTLTSAVSPLSTALPCMLIELFAADIFFAAPDYYDNPVQVRVPLPIQIVLFSLSIGTVAAISTVMWFVTVLISNIAVKLLKPPSISEKASCVPTVISKTSICLSCCLIAVAFASCGTLTMILGALFNIMHVFCMNISHLQASGSNSLPSSLNFQFSLSLLWILATILNLPSLLAWLRSLPPPPSPLSPDPSFIPALAMSACLCLIWNKQFLPTRQDRKASVSRSEQCVAVLLQLLAMMVVLIVWGSSGDISFVNLFIIASVISLSVQHLLAHGGRAQTSLIDSQPEGN